MRWISGNRPSPCARVLLGSIALVAFASAARAADSPGVAAQLFEDARGDMKRGDFAAARAKLIDSVHLEETVGTLFNLGLCEEKLGLVRNSLEHLRAALAYASDDDRRRPLMIALIESLERRASRVVLKGAPNDGPELRLTLDGHPVEASPDGHEVLVEPGEHELVVRARNGSTRTTAIHVDEGATVVQAVTFSPEPAIAPQAAPAAAITEAAAVPARDGQMRQRLGAVAVNAGGAAVIAGAVLGFMALGSKISVDHHCDTTGCDDEGKRASAQGSSYSTASTALTVGGIAALGIGGYALFGPGSTSARRTTARERSVGIIAGSVGAAAIVAGAIAGGVTLSAKRDLLDRCGDSGPCADPQALDAAARGRTSATVATVALGLGVASLGVASYSLLLRPRFAPSADVRLALSPTGIVCAATF
jgi:hypothetical protein